MREGPTELTVLVCDRCRQYSTEYDDASDTLPAVCALRKRKGLSPYRISANGLDPRPVITPHWCPKMPIAPAEPPAEPQEPA